jgi:hypothetical protein
MFPYFARRPAAVSPFGTEWTGRYIVEGRLFAELNACIDRESVDCAKERLRAAGVTIEVIVLPASGMRGVDAVLASDSEWTRTYTSEGYSVWQRLPARGVTRLPRSCNGTPRASGRVACSGSASDSSAPA